MNPAAADYEHIRALMREHTGVALDADKDYLVESRLTRMLKAGDIDSLAELVRRLQTEPPASNLRQDVIDAMLTGETSFFRDIKPFEVLKSHVLPELIEKRQAERRLHIWCGACSSGQEPYSIAMLLREHFPMLASWRMQLIATDMSRQMLERAKDGCYSQMEVGRGLPASLLIRYFRQAGLIWQIREEIRDMVRFEYLNLSEDWPLLDRMDLVFLRNVLIYFDADGKKSVLRKIRHILKPGGYLFLGGAETTAYLDNAYEPVHLDKTVCYRLRQT